MADCRPENKTIGQLEERTIEQRDSTAVQPALQSDTELKLCGSQTVDLPDQNHRCHDNESGEKIFQSVSLHKDNEPSADKDASETNSMGQDTVLVGEPLAVGESDSESSSSESDREASTGYVLLPQDPDGHHGSESDDENNDDRLIGNSSHEWDGAGGNSAANTESVDSGEDSGSVEPVSKMEDNEVNAIKQAMAGFSLPSSSTPDWAKVVPEEVWKSKLIKGLQKSQPKRTQ